MSRYRKVDPRIWNDAKFRELSDDAKLIFFMLLTHPNMTAIGAMRATISGLAEEIGWESEDFREAFAEVLSKDMAEHDKKACLIALPNFVRYNPPESPNVVKAWVNALDMLPECSLKTRVIARAADFAKGMNEGFAKALPEAFAKSMPIQEQEQEQEQEYTSANAEGAGTVVPRPDVPNCPHQDIIALYHELLPMGLQVRTWNGDRPRNLQARWREDKKRQSLEWWKKFFGYCAKSEFLTGRAAPARDRDPFVVSLDWLVCPKNFAKVLDGRYHREAA